jgi:bifunctional DNA-binding transcriptional regulator/antitoxin component of YhaV-PrlF toxin-antitoxin module
MAKITSKYQVTVPQAIAQQYGIRPGDDIEWVPAGEVIRVVLSRKKAAAPEDTESKLRLFDEATERHRKRSQKPAGTPPRNRGWTREDLYLRGRAR